MNYTMLIVIGLLIVGLVAGYLSGLIGIGGGIFIVPALIFIFGFTQYKAQGTTLALLVPPIGLLAVMNYYKQGYVDVKTAAIICIGFIIGSYLGSKTAVQIPPHILRKVFAVSLVVIAIKMYFQKN